MTRAHFVKAARKDNPVAKKGEPYYWWKFRRGSKQYSLKPPKPWQLTQSPFLQQLYQLQHAIENLHGGSFSEVEDDIDSLCGEIENLGEECRDSRANMPESLQDSDTGCLLEERADAMDNWAQELRNAVDNFDQEDGDINDLIEELQSIDSGV